MSNHSIANEATATTGAYDSIPGCVTIIRAHSPGYAKAKSVGNILRDLSQSLLEIGDKIIWILKTDRKTNQIRRNAGRLELCV